MQSDPHSCHLAIIECTILALLYTYIPLNPHNILLHCDHRVYIQWFLVIVHLATFSTASEHCVVSNMSHLPCSSLQIAPHHSLQSPQYCTCCTVMVIVMFHCNVHQCSPMFTNVRQCSPMFTNVHQCSPMHCTIRQQHILPQLQRARHHFSLSAKTKCVPNHHQGSNSLHRAYINFHSKQMF